MITDIARVRQFNRATAVEIGALDESFLSQGRPLGSARVLNCIGHGLDTVADIRKSLRLDTGLLSRLLRGLEGEGLITTHPHPQDKRSRIARLTTAGAEAFATYETLSDARAQQMLARHKHPARLLEAMDILALAFAQEDILIEEADPTSDAAVFCVTSYAQELSARMGLKFDLAKSGAPDLDASMMRPKGVFFLAKLKGRPLGCVGVKGDGSDIGEVKRLWTLPAARGLGLAKKLMAAAELAAQDMGMTRLRLDTNRAALPEAVMMYQKSGWQEIDRFNDNPYPDLFMQKQIG